MMIAQLKSRAEDQRLTISECVQLLADQDTRNEASHAQMHLREVLPSDPGKIKGLTAPQALERSKVWTTGDLHLTPAHKALAPTGNRMHPSGLQAFPRGPVDGGAPVLPETAPDSGAVYLDSTRLPVNDSYKRRHGLNLPAVPATTEQRDHVLFKAPGEKAPKPHEQRVAGDGTREYLHNGVWTPVPTDAVGKKAFVFEKSGDLKILKKEVIVTDALPAISSPPHSMFEDPEAMAVLLAATLTSSAGVEMLTILNASKSAKHRAVVFSRTAAKWTRAFFQTKAPKAAPLKMVTRQANVDAKRNIDAVNGTYTELDLDHVVLVAERTPEGRFKIVTFFPSTDPIAKTTGIATRLNEDLLEKDGSVKPKQYSVIYQRLDRTAKLAW